MANAYFTAEFAGIPILIAEIETVEGRDVVVQSPHRGNRHRLSDQGQAHRAATAKLLFIDQPNQAPYLDRFEAIRQIANGDSSQTFSHPILGVYRAKMGNFTHRASADELKIEASCVLYAEDEPQAVFPVGAGTTGAAGLEAVTVAAGNADTALEAVGIESDTPTGCVDAVAGWSEAEELDSAKVFLEAASLVEELNTEIEGLTVSLNQWPAYRAMCLLRYQVVRAAESFTSATERLLDVVVDADLPLLTICTEIYGAALALDMRDKVQKLNRLRTPGRVPRGTTLKVPAEGAA